MLGLYQVLRVTKYGYRSLNFLLWVFYIHCYIKSTVKQLHKQQISTIFTKKKQEKTGVDNFRFVNKSLCMSCVVMMMCGPGLLD